MTATRVAEREKTRRRTWWALVISLLVHITVILAVASIYFLEIKPPPDPVEEIEITIVQPPAAPPKPTFVDTSAPEAEKPPENAPFESDRDTAAASPDAATGAEPLPSQEGKEQPFPELENQELALAEVKDTPPAPEAPPAQPAPPQPQQPEEKQEAKREEQKPQKVETDALVVAAQTQPQEKKRDEPKTPPAQPPSRPPSYQRQARPTRLSGSVSNRGRSAVASMATPLGRYRKQITDAIGSSWYHHIGPRMDIFSYGTVSVVFVIDRNGKARRPRVVSNTSNESFEIVTVESILAADIPPIPPDIVPTLEGGQIEMDYTFSIITN